MVAARTARRVETGGSGDRQSDANGVIGEPGRGCRASAPLNRSSTWKCGTGSHTDRSPIYDDALGAQCTLASQSLEDRCRGCIGPGKISAHVSMLLSRDRAAVRIFPGPSGLAWHGRSTTNAILAGRGGHRISTGTASMTLSSQDVVVTPSSWKPAVANSALNSTSVRSRPPGETSICRSLNFANGPARLAER